MSKIYFSVLIALIIINVVSQDKVERNRFDIVFKRTNISVLENNRFAELVTRRGTTFFQWKMDIPPSGPNSLRYVLGDNWIKPIDYWGYDDPRSLCPSKTITRDFMVQSLISPDFRHQSECIIPKGSRSFEKSPSFEYFFSSFRLNCNKPNKTTVIKLLPEGDDVPIARIDYATNIFGSKCS